MITFTRAIAFVTFSFVVLPAAHAWGADAHRLVADLAQTQLTMRARAEVHRLLAVEGDATLASVSTWADEHRRTGTAPLHYVNVPSGVCAYSRPRDCPGGRCVVEAITEQLAILGSHAPDAERLVALKWVVHLIADVHQPLHVGLASDKGGNLFQVRAFGRGSNLHAVWDTELVKRRPGGVSKLLRDAATMEPPVPFKGPADWAEESCEVRRRAGFYPEDRRIGTEYASQWDGELVRRLSLAGARLAQALNAALGSP